MSLASSNTSTPVPSVRASELGHSHAHKQVSTYFSASVSCNTHRCRGTIKTSCPWMSPSSTQVDASFLSGTVPSDLALTVSP
ncbi:hypothetical protein PHYPO_G00237330 [Pangasianodon hypophthalmus]|uniref:Uncharacterized protein n=1 Tax=Pangasianodon hypophthalmus TaxID=310915 RepID=A0A5N5NJV1_PANHP|nr:hypothetical protein PHYPO_G00237330 [Pangasianodon hypophthalmus]